MTHTFTKLAFNYQMSPNMTTVCTSIIQIMSAVREIRQLCPDNKYLSAERVFRSTLKPHVERLKNRHLWSPLQFQKVMTLLDFDLYLDFVRPNQIKNTLDHLEVACNQIVKFIPRDCEVCIEGDTSTMHALVTQ